MLPYLFKYEECRTKFIHSPAVLLVFRGHSCCLVLVYNIAYIIKRNDKQNGTCINKSKQQQALRKIYEKVLEHVFILSEANTNTGPSFYCDVRLRQFDSGAQFA